jgi:hypothetical protein
MRPLARITLTRTLAVVVTLALVVTLAGCGTTSTPTDQPAPAPGAAVSLGTVIFDMGHGEVFGADDTSELGQSQAIQRIMAAGFDVAVNPDRITAEDLADASGLMIAGPMIPLTDEEYDAITAFVERGGTVLLTIHVPYPVLKVPAHWGLPVDTQILMSQRPYANPAEPSVFVADQIEPHPITEGVSQVVVVSGWPVATASDQAKLVVSTGEDTWVSEAGDQAPTPPAGTMFGSYGVIGITQAGKGQVIVCGDDAVFANLALGAGDNAKLLDNIIRMMSLMSET